MILLREQRVKARMTQKALADITGVPQQTISAIESGESQNPGIETIYQLSVGLKCSINELYRPDAPEETK